MNVHFASAVPQFAVADVVRTARYYERMLGFEVVGYWDGERVHHDDHAPAVFGIVQRDGVRLHFYRSVDPGVRGKRDEVGRDVYFHVTGIDDLAEHLRKGGADIVEGPEDTVYGQRELVVRDSDGFVLAFGEQPTSG